MYDYCIINGMTTINISLPDELKHNAEKLIASGHYASFSDLVRHSLRQTISADTYDKWALDAIFEHQQGKTKALNSLKDIDTFTQSL
jgi:Arc/MetJ-type ribon-helix-helix transcriptional regulator